MPPRQASTRGWQAAPGACWWSVGRYGGGAHLCANHHADALGAPLPAAQPEAGQVSGAAGRCACWTALRLPATAQAFLLARLQPPLLRPASAPWALLVGAAPHLNTKRVPGVRYSGRWRKRKRTQARSPLQRAPGRPARESGMGSRHTLVAAPLPCVTTQPPDATGSMFKRHGCESRLAAVGCSPGWRRRRRRAHLRRRSRSMATTRAACRTISQWMTAW